MVNMQNTHRYSNRFPICVYICSKIVTHLNCQVAEKKLQFIGVINMWYHFKFNIRTPAGPNILSKVALVFCVGQVY